VGEGGVKAFEQPAANLPLNWDNSIIRPALLGLGSGFAVPNRGHLNQPFNLVARRSEQLFKAQVDFRRPARDIRQGREYSGTLNSAAPRLAGTSVVPFKIAGTVQDAALQLSLRPIDAGFAKLSLDTALHAKPSSQSPHKSPNEYRAGLAPLLIMSFLLGAAGVAIVPAVAGKITAMTAAHFRSGGNSTDIGWTNDPLALPRMQRDNRLLSYLDFVINRGTKQPYDEVPVPASGPASQADATAETGVEDQTPPDGDALTAGPETPIEGGVKSLPSLYFDPSTGKQVIGNFATRSFPGDHGACTEIAQEMLLDAQAKQDALFTLADTQAIKVMRFCAGNGAVIITCRNGRITISPRRPRPNDGCSGRQAL
jgi:hypothetical protein